MIKQLKAANCPVGADRRMTKLNITYTVEETQSPGLIGQWGCEAGVWSLHSTFLVLVTLVSVFHLKFSTANKSCLSASLS